MNSLTITLKTSETERYIPNGVITTLYNIGKDDDEHQSLTSGIDTTDVNRPVTSVEGSIAVRVTYDDYIRYLAVKFPNLHITADSTYIKFADSNMESLCVTAFSSDQTGLTLADAQLVSKIPANFAKDNTSITSFDELGYFGSILILGNAFYGCSNLTSINLLNVTLILGGVFMGCSNLRIKVNAPNLTSLGGRAFMESGILEVEDLGLIVEIPLQYGRGAFSNCTNLTKVVLPYTLLRIQTGAFAGCTNLTQIEGLNYVNTLGNEVFVNTGSFLFIVNFANVTSVGSVCVGNNRGTDMLRRKQIYFPKLTASANGSYWSNWYNHAGTFLNVNTDLIYFRDIQAFHPYDFCHTSCTALVINNTTPPSWNNNSDRSDADQQALQDYQGGWRENMLGQSTIGTIYVPDSAVNTYKQDSNWSTVLDKILPLSLLTKVATEEDLLESQIALIEAYM